MKAKRRTIFKTTIAYALIFVAWGLPGVSNVHADSTGFQSPSLEPGIPPEELDPCDAFSDVEADVRRFATTFANGDLDLDDDGLLDLLSLDLLQAVSCNSLSDELLRAATTNAYNINLAIFDGEVAAATLAEFREAIALLAAVSGSLEMAIKDVLALAEPAITLTGDYVSATCVGGACMPDAIEGRSVRDEFFVFERPSRSIEEPFSALGDLDGDGTDNVTEYNNVVAQGGSAFDFIVAATSAELDGTEPIVAPGAGSSGGGCFIATAAYGTPLANEIGVLHGLRDRFLLEGPLGTAFVDTYYRLSPSIADRVAAHPVLRATVRVLLVPVVIVAGLLLGDPAILFALAMVFAASAATYRVRHRRRGHVR